METVVGILPNGTTTTINDLLLLIQDKAACAVVLGHPTLIIDLQPWQPVFVAPKGGRSSGMDRIIDLVLQSRAANCKQA